MHTIRAFFYLIGFALSSKSRVYYLKFRKGYTRYS